MNKLLQIYMSKKVCRKCKATQSPRRKTCLKGCGSFLRPRRAPNK